jgi:outer membrane autotransporter protein
MMPFLMVASLDAGLATPPSSLKDWYFVDDQWFLDANLVGDSANANSDSDRGALTLNTSATINAGGSWTGLQLENPLMIAFDDYGTLTLGGDLSATTDYEYETVPLSGAVGFFNGGVLSGTGDISITTNVDGAPLVLAGVYSNDLGASPEPIEADAPQFAPGSLDITDYSGNITVINDNSSGSAAVSGTDLDFSKAAIAVGIAAVESDSGLNPGTIHGAIQQQVTTTAISRDAELTLRTGDQTPPPVLTGAIAVGVVGALVDGIASTATIETTAQSGQSILTNDEVDATTISLNLGLAVGVGGLVGDIEDGATITTTASSGFSKATAPDAGAFANNVALAASVIGAISDKSEVIEADEPAALTTTITTTATAANSTAIAGDRGEGTSEAASVALALGVGGFAETLSNTSIISSASSGRVTATSETDAALGLSVTAAIGVLGVVGEMDQTVITSTATSGSSSAQSSSSTNDLEVSATSLALAGGVIGQVGSATDLTLNVTANAGQSVVLADTSEEFSYAAADATAVAFGVSSGEFVLPLIGGEVLGPVLEPVLGDMDMLSGLPLEGLGDIAGGLISGSPVSDGIEGGPLAGNSWTINGAIIANAASADASGEIAYAASNAYAIGHDSPLFTDEVDGTLAVTANAANANAAGATSDSLANAFAGGFVEVYTDAFSGELTVTANAGTATASSAPFGSADPSRAEATANASGIRSVEGNLTATSSFTIAAIGGVAQVVNYSQLSLGDEIIEGNGFSGYSADASAEAQALGLGDIEGSVAATFNVLAEGGEAYASSGESSSGLALAFADASGIETLIGEFSGEMTVTALGGTAILEKVLIVTPPEDQIESLVELGDFADASAIASGIGNGDDAVSGIIGGSITVTATGGTAASINPLPGFDLPVGDVIESEVLISETSFNAYAQAIGVDGTVLSDEVSALITVDATGGTVIGSLIAATDSIESTPVDIAGLSDASAFAAGIAGYQVGIDNVTGGITVTATAGLTGPALLPSDDPIEADGPELPILPELDTENAVVDNAFAAGIMTYDNYVEVINDAIEGEDTTPSLLDVVISTYVHTFVKAPVGYDLSENSYAAAVYSGQGDDNVELADGADIIGDINTGGGLNTLTVTGDTVMQGNILSTSLDWINEWLEIDNGFGTVDFDIDSGLFTAVRTVNVSDLEDTLEIAAAGGLAPILSQSPLDGDTSVLKVGYGDNGETAAVNIASGAKVLPVFAEGVDLKKVLGNEYTIITAEQTITDNGAIVDNSQTPFEYTLKVVGGIVTDVIDEIESNPFTGDEYVLTVDRVKDQDGEQTPGSVQAAQAISAASQAVMLDVSKHASLLRSLLRRSPASNASNGSAPTGPAGPKTGDMRNGDWLSYVSVFGNIGSQDSGSGYAGFDYDTYGLVIGMERLMGPQLVLGLAGSYAKTDIDGNDNSGSGDSDLYSVGVYANWFTDTWYVDGGVTYGQSDNDVDRIDFKGDKYRGNYDSELFGTWAEVGYTTAHGDFGLEPYARFSYVYGDHDGFTDEGADDLVMTTDDHETDNFKTELGARMNREWTYEDKSSFLVEVKAAWEHEWADRGVSVNSSYLGDTNLDIDSADADRDALVLGVRVEWSYGDGLSLGVEYEPTISGNWYNHAFSGTVQYNW